MKKLTKEIKTLVADVRLLENFTKMEKNQNSLINAKALYNDCSRRLSIILELLKKEYKS